MGGGIGMGNTCKSMAVSFQCMTKSTTIKKIIIIIIKLSAEELMLLNCGVGEDSGESLGLQGDPSSSS